jgi:hypothetical protein
VRNEFVGKDLRSRREFLSGFVKVGGLAAVASVVPAAEASASTTRANETSVRPAIANNSRYASDGLLIGFVEGTLVSSSGGAMLLAPTRPGVGPIQVALPSTTEVLSRGSRVAGVLSACVPGDLLSVGTYFAPNGQRVAQWVNANMASGTGTILDMSDTDVVISPIGKSADRAAALGLSAMTVHVHPTANVFGRSATTVGSTAPLSGATVLYFAGSCDGPYAGWAEESWAYSIAPLWKTAKAIAAGA